MVSFLAAYPVLYNYRRRLLARSGTLYVKEYRRSAKIGTAVFAMITGAVTLFWVFVAVVSVARGVERGLYGWVLILAAAAFFGTLTFIVSPMNAKTTFTEEGIICTSGNFFWSQIKDYRWEAWREDQFLLFIVVRFFGVNIPLPVRGLLADSGEVKSISKIMDRHLKGRSGRGIA